MKKIMFILSFLLFSGFFVPAMAANLTVGSEIGATNETFHIPISVDNPDKLAGAAFTLVYSSSLTICVESEFFDTFYNQLDPLATTDTPEATASGYRFPLLDAAGEPVLDDSDDPVYIEIPVLFDGQEYFQPLLTNL